MVHGREVIFTWMDMDKWGDWMKSMYGIRMAYDGSGTLDDVPVIISDHKVRPPYSLFYLSLTSVRRSA